MRTRYQDSRRRSLRLAPTTAQPTRRSQRIADRSTTEDQSKSDTVPSTELASDIQAAMANNRARGRRRNGVIAESCRTAAPPLPSRPAGLWDMLPPELLEMILDKCSATQLAKLETCCSFFRRTKVIQTVAEARLRAIPRAKGTVPDRR